MDEITRRFQPALPMRGVTRRTWLYPFHSMISTRTPHAGSDSASSYHAMPICPFQPALPMRGVTFDVDRLASSRDISTRTPHAGSDLETVELFWFASISTRTPHAGSDHALNKIIAVHADFNPHSPCGE